MIAIIAGNYKEAETWARGQNLSSDEWFFPFSIDELNYKRDFHVIVIGTAGQNTPIGFFERVYQLAKSRGAMK